jgi:membrane-bound metal-dependent hydrolase YbcI (DUF457 family)
MQGPSHLVISWFVADASGLDKPRERRIVAWCGLAPDFDVVAYLAALVWYRFDKELAFENVWKVIHHRYTHNLAFVFVAGAVAYWLARGDPRSRLKVAILAMLACALHNFLDLVGGGPTWPIYPLWPASDFPWHAAWSWTIGDWPNIVILAACLVGTLAYGRFAGYSPVECFGDRADRWTIQVLQRGSVASSGRMRLAIWAAVLAAAAAILAPLGFNPFR